VEPIVGVRKQSPREKTGVCACGQFYFWKDSSCTEMSRATLMG